MALLSPKWINQVLKQRGIPVLDVPKLQAAIDLSLDGGEKIYQAVRRIEQGVDDAQTLPWLRKQCADAAEVGPSVVSNTASNQGSGHSQRIASPNNDVKLSASPEKVGATNPEGPRNRVQRHIYGGKAALTVELDTLKEKGVNGQDVFSVLLEIAPGSPGSAYDWTRKIPFQITLRELPLLAATLLGYRSKLSFMGHGPAANKKLLIEDQGEKLFVKIGDGRNTLSLPVTASDVHAWSEIALEALLRNSPKIDSMTQMHLLKRVGAMQ